MRKQELLDDEEQEQRQKEEKQRQEQANALTVTPAVEGTSPVAAVELPESVSSHDKLIEIPQQVTNFTPQNYRPEVTVYPVESC